MKFARDIFRLWAFGLGLWILPAFAQSDYTATTDTNGHLTWPPQLFAGDVAPFTNTTLAGGNNSSASWSVTPDGHFVFTDSNGMVTRTAPKFFSVSEANGNGFYYSNGVMYLTGSTIFDPNFMEGITKGFDGNTNIPPPASVTNLQLAFNTFTSLVWSAFSASNNIYQAAFAASNSTVFNAFNATNANSTNMLAAMIGTTGVSITNWIALNGFWLTNYATNLAGLTFAASSNYTASVSNSLTSYALNLFISTNMLATHFRFGSLTYSSVSSFYTFSPGFNDPNFLTYFSSATLSQATQPITYWGYAYAYNQFVFLVNTNGAYGSTVNYMLYHP